ncbi:pheromone A receptor-domain-containing protein [Vararia minispora EC-137]|uniref:Pheromone A receptor-domain-containing protein n=1 Tax=Vararia minispora EC-137 TaxID=1314806 RepID=A0ACB8QCQ2_9AGAM|nr:pheromone A receptor-domain-containing protein [Vararia minispora EC-137]
MLSRPSILLLRGLGSCGCLQLLIRHSLYRPLGKDLYMRVLIRALTTEMLADPSYPFYTVIAIITAALLLLLLTANLARRSWNPGVSFLCFWLFWELLFGGIDAVIWRDNMDLKLPIYCDIVSHVEVFAAVVKPACTLIIARRLYKVTSLRSVGPSTREELFDTAFEWCVGAGIPALVTGILCVSEGFALDYIVQDFRFVIQEGIGCCTAIDSSGLAIIFSSWSITLPLISIIFYFPRILCIFYKHNRDTNRFLNTNDTTGMSRRSYFRILAIGSLDIVFTLPIGITNIILQLREAISTNRKFPFYAGWGAVHSDWAPVGLPFNLMQRMPDTLMFNYVQRWASPALGLTIFALFGLTDEVRATYRRGLLAAAGIMGWTLPVCKHEDVGEIRFGERPLRRSYLSIGASSIADDSLRCTEEADGIPSASMPAVSRADTRRGEAIAEG